MEKILEIYFKSVFNKKCLMMAKKTIYMIGFGVLPKLHYLTFKSCLKFQVFQGFVATL